MPLALVTPPAVQAEPTKVCANPECSHGGARQPWSNFWPKVKWPDGSTRQPHSRCKDCQRAYVRDWHRRKRESDPEWQRGRYQRAHESLRSDPDRYAFDLARRREWKRKRYGYRVVRPRRSGVVAVPDDRVEVPSAPFSAWLHTLGQTSLAIARACGLSDSQVRKYLRGEHPMVAIDTVDRALLNAHTLTTLDDLYPLEEAA